MGISIAIFIMLLSAILILYSFVFESEKGGWIGAMVFGIMAGFILVKLVA